MTDNPLRDCKILVVEDEYLLAEDLCTILTDEEATVIGPADTVEQGLALIRENGLSGAILDINPRGEPVFHLADALISRDIPFIFTTGYDAASIPDRFGHIKKCEKPVRLSHLVTVIGTLFRPRLPHE